MRISGFAWLPDIVDKIESKHHLNQDEVEEYSSIDLGTGSSSAGIGRGRMCMLLPVRPMQGDI